MFIDQIHSILPLLRVGTYIILLVSPDVGRPVQIQVSLCGLPSLSFKFEDESNNSQP